MELLPELPPAEFAPPLRVLVAAENTLARAGLAALLAERPGLSIAGQVSLDDQLDAALDLYRPDVVIGDLGYDPQGLAELLSECVPDGPPFVALVADGAAAASAVTALFGAGVRGLLLHTTPPDGLAAALLAAGHGMTVIGPGIRWALADAPPPAAPAQLGETFTPREREVLALLAEGLPNKLIARRLAISEHTVKFHVNGLLTKLGAASRTEAVVRATRLGLIAL